VGRVHCALERGLKADLPTTSTHALALTTPPLVTTKFFSILIAGMGIIAKRTNKDTTLHRLQCRDAPAWLARILQTFQTIGGSDPTPRVMSTLRAAAASETGIC
jgi:hypothetical protein